MRWALAHHWDSNRSHMKNKSHDITKGELSAESQERRLRNYDPAKHNLASKVTPLHSTAGVDATNEQNHDFRKSMLERMKLSMV